MEERLPPFGSRKKDCDQHCADRANDAVEEGGKRESFMSSLQFLDSFMKVDYAIEERENLCGKRSYIAHGPIVRVERCQEYMHPTGMDK